MKKSIIILFFIVPFSLISQNYKVTYGLTILENEKSLKSEIEYVRKSYEWAMQGAKNISFELICDGKVSFFTEKESLYINSRETKAAILNSGGSYPIYIVNDTLYKDKKEDNIFGEAYIVKDTLLKNWNITDEAKTINNYICYKATTKYKLVNPVGTFFHPVTAWFCPEIPLQHGPRGFGGLPGLILELQYREVVFGATKIEETTEKVEINLKGYKISQEEYDKKIQDLAKSRFSEE